MCYTDTYVSEHSAKSLEIIIIIIIYVYYCYFFYGEGFLKLYFMDNL